ncbi:MAG: RCC1 domain-containing protein, partial [Bdellovibrionia bacterium]
MSLNGRSKPLYGVPFQKSLLEKSLQVFLDFVSRVAESQRVLKRLGWVSILVIVIFPGKTSAGFNIGMFLKAQRTGTPYSKVSGGAYHSCGITNRGVLKCWGSNSSGQVGNGSLSGDQTFPVAINSTTAYLSVATGNSHSCGIANSGILRCWGDNTYGQLGLGSSTPSQSSPVQVNSTSAFIAVSAGGSHTCGITGSGLIQCWGNNTSGQLGVGSSTPSQSSPVQINSTSTYVAVVAGASHSCGIRSSGPIECWGDNTYGQLGMGSSTPFQISPVQVNSTTPYIALAAGSSHSCGITISGSIECWGRNRTGQLGDGTTTQRNSPVQVSSTTSFISLAAGSAHTCAITGSGSMVCWGDNSAGQLGDGTTTQRNSPVQVSSTTSFVSLSAGGYHTCGMTSGGSLLCWGGNSNGQVGNRSTLNQITPKVIDLS